MTTDSIIIAILAAVDAQHVPNRRSQHDPPSGVQWLAQREYRRYGLRWSAAAVIGRGDGAARKQAERALDKAAADGLVALSHVAERRSHAKLTDLGEQRGRALVALPYFHESAALVDRIRAAGGGWIDETSLGVDVASKDAKYQIVRLEEVALPLIIRGFLEANSTYRGNVSYRLTGRTADMPTDLDIDPDEHLCAAYRQAFGSERARLRMEPRTSEIGLVPLPG